MRQGAGFVTLVGPGLTENVDEERLRTNALWEAVTGTAGAQDWYEQIRVTGRPSELDPEAARARRDANAGRYAEQRERAKAAKTEPLSAAQLKYLQALITKVSRERFNEDFARAIKGSGAPPRSDGEKTAHAIERLTKDTARKLITALKGEH